MFRKARQMHSFRLDETSSERLKSMAVDLGASQGELLEQLINACFDSACTGYEVSGFQRFADRCKEITRREVETA